ncbi:MAG: TrkA family potassium uptake protein [Candidatus Omnitrophica bacterium]|nr:TrkA family potassium uptake protein [Candidatus Omnitrophota bacterium]
MRQFAVIGLGRFGSSVARTLSEKGKEVIGIDAKEQVVQEMSEVISQAVCVEAKDEKALKALGIQNVDVAIVAIGELEASILITLTLKEMGIKEIVVKAVNDDHKKVLEKIGATRIVMPERDMGQRIASSLVTPQVLDHIDLSADSSIVEIVSPPDFVGKSLRDLNIRAEHRINVIAIKRKIKSLSSKGDAEDEEKIIVTPQANEIIRSNDVLIVIGPNDKIEVIKKKH